MNGSTPSLDAALVVGVVGWTILLGAHLLSRLAVVARLLPDKPNDRSSHEVVTPRSGGGAIFFAWALGMGILAVFEREVAALSLQLTLIAGAVFLFGLADDRLGLKATVKFGFQTIIAIVFVVLFGGFERFPVPVVGEIDLGLLASVLTVVWIVGFMNAFNFMDGLNGIAAGCAALVLLALSLAAGGAGASYWAIVAAFAGIAACGFLPVNFPEGRLFMGDNGSQTLGFLIAVLAVAASNSALGVSALFIPTIMTPFLLDVGFTLAHRLRRRQNVLSAHREHVYQLLARLGTSPASVAALYMSATAICAASAFLMLALAPRSQWIAPVVLTTLLTPIGFIVYRRARDAGLLPDAASEPDAEIYTEEEPESGFEESLARVAE